MRDIGGFQTDFGVADLVLNQIPYSKSAYIHLSEILEAECLIEECRQFCVACGAERVFVCGTDIPEKFPEFMHVVEMRGSVELLPETDACLMPVTEPYLARWMEIYRDRMKGVDNALYLSIADGKQMVETGGGYFVHRDGSLLGIGKVKDNVIECIASVEPGAGSDVLIALTHALNDDMVCLEVASTNHRAIRLYEKLGFVKCGVLRTWHRVM